MLAAIFLLACALSPQGAEAPDLRSEEGAVRRERLERGIAARHGWQLYETPSYFVVSDVDDRAVLSELRRRADALRAWLSDTVSASEVGCCFPGPAGPAPSAPHKSIVRLFAARAEYRDAGGEAVSNATYRFTSDEILLWCGPGAAGRKRLWRDLQACVASEYLASRWGAEELPAWFERGLRSTCASFGTRDRAADPKPDSSLLARAAQLVAAGEFVRLDELLTSTARDFEESPDLQVRLWSFVWFLEVRHRELLRSFLDAFRKDRDGQAATVRAFELEDCGRLESEWRAFAARPR